MSETTPTEKFNRQPLLTSGQRNQYSNQLHLNKHKKYKVNHEVLHQKQILYLDVCMAGSLWLGHVLFPLINGWPLRAIERPQWDLEKKWALGSMNERIMSRQWWRTKKSSLTLLGIKSSNKIFKKFFEEKSSLRPSAISLNCPKSQESTLRSYYSA